MKTREIAFLIIFTILMSVLIGIVYQNTRKNEAYIIWLEKYVFVLNMKQQSKETGISLDELIKPYMKKGWKKK